MGESSDSSAFDDRDLYCLQCGYNLRGLSGDPRRCPECGHLNPMGDLEIPAALISRQLRAMETSLTLSVAGILILVWFLCSAVVVASASGSSPDDRIKDTTCFVYPMPIGILMTLFGRHRFKQSCLGKAGWSMFFSRYVRYGSIMGAVILLGIPVVILTLHGRKGKLTGDPKSDTILGAMLVLATSLIVAAIILFAKWRIYPSLKEEKDRLQREVAVTLARQRLRESLDRSRGPFRKV
jgi:peptidoglycan/LPS O-acetylase OafA/YrhL